MLIKPQALLKLLKKSLILTSKDLTRSWLLANESTSRGNLLIITKEIEIILIFVLMLVFLWFGTHIMLTSLNLCSILEKYCYYKKISEKEIDFLERTWLNSLNSLHYNRYPGIAPAIVCDEAGVARGSYWITCNAALLDKIRPLKETKCRNARVLEVLLQSGLLAA